MKRMSDEMKIYVGKQNEGDPLSLILSTEDNGTFVSNSGTKNKSNAVNGMNTVYVSGDKNYVSKYLVDWIISKSTVVINSRLAIDGDSVNIVNTTVSRTIQFITDDTTNAIPKNLFRLLSFNDNVRTILLADRNKFVVEDEMGKAVIKSKVQNIGHFIQLQKRRKLHINC